MAETSKEENEPSDLDETTHLELSAMYRDASVNILFAKLVQWIVIGLSSIVFATAVTAVNLSPSGKTLANLFTIAIILLTCGAMFMLFMYQMWQFNEIKRIRRIEKHFSTLCRRINNIESRGERNVERYTMLFAMAAAVACGALVAIFAIR
jgi:hypothetical protein